MKKIVGTKTIKTGIGATMAMILAQGVGLKYSASAGIITILSVQNTRKESVQIAMKRVIAACIALMIGGGLFRLLGYMPIVFGVYLIVFIPAAVKLKVTEGIVPASVLVTHLLGEQSTNMSLILNELLLVLVGVAVALVVNLYMPSIEKELLKEKQIIEEEMFDLFVHMTKILERKEEEGAPNTKESPNINHLDSLHKLETALVQGREKARQNANNYFIQVQSPYEKYFEMRSNQYQVMTYMLRHLSYLFMNVEQSQLVASFTRRVAECVKGKIVVEELLDELERLRETFKASELPNSREEFENRAMLYQLLNDMEQFLRIKKAFKEQLTWQEMKEYTKYYTYS